MGSYFTAYYPQVTFAVDRNMGAVLNSSGAVYIRRIGLINAQATGVSGALCQLNVYAYTSGDAGLTGATQVIPVAHDTRTGGASAFCAYLGTPTGTTQTLRRVFWSSDEQSNAAGTLDELETIVPLYVIFDAGYENNDVQPFTLRAGQMIAVMNLTGAAGRLDTWIEFERV